jgi:hypothetical protein
VLLFRALHCAYPSLPIIGYGLLEKNPEAGDVVFGKVRRIGHHSSLENVSGRIHTIHNGTKAFLFLVIDMLPIIMRALYLMNLFVRSICCPFRNDWSGSDKKCDVKGPDKGANSGLSYG